jgi:uncharacterized protein YndB with AHSA1/START domain
MEILRTVTVDRPITEVFAYLSDFTTTTQWDPGTVRTTREAGDGGVGTRYRNQSTFLGRTTELTYFVTDHEPPARLALRGENGTVVAHDTMTLVQAPDGGTQITYRAVFTFKGWARLIAPFTAPAFRRLGDEAADGLRTALVTGRP